MTTFFLALTSIVATARIRVRHRNLKIFLDIYGARQLVQFVLLEVYAPRPYDDGKQFVQILSYIFLKFQEQLSLHFYNVHAYNNMYLNATSFRTICTNAKTMQFDINIRWAFNFNFVSLLKCCHRQSLVCTKNNFVVVVSHKPTFWSLDTIWKFSISAARPKRCRVWDNFWCR
jgi:hypothetical protein